MERWRQIESLFQEALQRDPAERMPGWRRPVAATPGCRVKSHLCLRITMKPPSSSPGPRLRRRN